jgi:hypothetical protein
MALRGNPSQNPPHKARRRGAAGVRSFATIFYLYLILNWLSVRELWKNSRFSWWSSWICTNGIESKEAPKWTHPKRNGASMSCKKRNLGKI